MSNKSISQWTLLMWTWMSIHSRDSTETSTDHIYEPSVPSIHSRDRTETSTDSTSNYEPSVPSIHSRDRTETSTDSTSNYEPSVPSNLQIYQDRDCERLSSWPGIFSSWLSFIYMMSIHVGLIGDAWTIVFGIVARDPPRQIPIGTLWVLCMCLLYWILFLLVGYICHSTFPKLYAKTNIKMQGPISAVIQQLRRRKCTEPQDIYYGVQAILGRLGIQPVAREQLQQLHTIYKYLFLSLLRKTRTLNLLLCTSSPGVSQAPSWIPDWSRTDEYSWFNDRYLGLSVTDKIAWHTQYLPVLFYKYPTCSGPFRGRLSIRDDRELVLYGKVAGQVTWISQEFLVTGDVLDESDIAKHIHNVAILQDFGAQVRTWSPLRIRSRQELHPLLYMFYDKTNDFSLRPRIKLYVQSLRWFLLIIGFLGRPATDLLAKLRSNPRLLSYHITMCNNLAKKRRIFAQIAGEAFKGTYGNLPAGTQVGDPLVLIEDVSFPAILRANQDEGNCLIGFAEVGHVGVMTGAVWWSITKDGMDSFSLI